MVFGAGFSWFHLIEPIGHDTLLAGIGIHHHTTVIAHAWLGCILVILLALVARRSLDKARSRQGIERYFADERLTPRTGAEVFATGILSVMGGIVDPRDARVFFSLIAALFSYIFVNNLLGIIPGLLPPTDNINTNVGMAVIVFLVFNFVGLSRDPVGYIKHLMGPMLLLAPLLFVIEAIGLVVRPVSLSLRLTGNMFGDHTVFGIMSSLVPIGLPVAFLALATFVSFVQAFVFSLLSTIYIGLSVPHHDHDDHH